MWIQLAIWSCKIVLHFKMKSESFPIANQQHVMDDRARTMANSIETRRAPSAVHVQPFVNCEWKSGNAISSVAGFCLLLLLLFLCGSFWHFLCHCANTKFMRMDYIFYGFDKENPSSCCWLNAHQKRMNLFDMQNIQSIFYLHQNIITLFCRRKTSNKRVTGNFFGTLWHSAAFPFALCSLPVARCLVSLRNFLLLLLFPFSFYFFFFLFRVWYIYFYFLQVDSNSIEQICALIQNTLWDIEAEGRFVKHQTFVMNNIYDLDAPIIQKHGLFMIILSNI